MLEDFGSDWHWFLLKCLVEFSTGALWFRAFLCCGFALFFEYLYGFFADYKNVKR